MKTIIKRTTAKELPRTLRGNVDPDAQVRITVEVLEGQDMPLQISDLVGAGRRHGIVRKTADIDETTNRQRDQWQR